MTTMREVILAALLAAIIAAGILLLAGDQAKRLRDAAAVITEALGSAGGDQA